jgi:hypothetical protein
MSSSDPAPARSTPPTSPSKSVDEENEKPTSLRQSTLRNRTLSMGRAETSKPTTGKDLRSFFEAKPSSSLSTPIRSRANRSTPSATATARARPKLEQLQLNIDGASNTAHCPQCGMSYAIGTPEDAVIHDKHHRRTVVGVDYAGWKSDVVIRDGVLVPGGGEGKLVMVDGSVEGAQGRKVSCSSYSSLFQNLTRYPGGRDTRNGGQVAVVDLAVARTTFRKQDLHLHRWEESRRVCCRRTHLRSLPRRPLPIIVDNNLARPTSSCRRRRTRRECLVLLLDALPGESGHTPNLRLAVVQTVRRRHDAPQRRRAAFHLRMPSAKDGCGVQPANGCRPETGAHMDRSKRWSWMGSLRLIRSRPRGEEGFIRLLFFSLC